LKYIGVLIITTGIMLCAVEFTARMITDKGWVSYFQPIHVQRLIRPSQQSEDWRLTHMMRDEQFVPDARLLWKPKKGDWRFNKDGYIGRVGLAEVDMSHASNACVILALGDSNTQGIENNSWPEELDKLLLSRGMNSRVINAGVAGYTSMQGQQKLNEVIDRIRPTVLFISFGWNDAAPSMGIPDNEFVNHYSPIFEILSKSRLFLIFKNWYTVDPLSAPYVPRVSARKYLENVQNMISESEKRDTKVVLVTRPYNATHLEGWRGLDLNKGGWRMSVPLYNEVIRDLAHKHNLSLFDLQKTTEFLPSRFIDDSHFSSAEYLDVALEAFELIQTDALCGIKLGVE
ncbi:hypothetical protein KBC80_02820, partial [Candidatus Woesebacteria bacterium]|nr:hypothetical protein [Candidatus Woesebacteria bacterium]